MPAFGARLKHAWNSFFVNDENERPTYPVPYSAGVTTSSRPDRVRVRVNSERTIISSIYTRLAIDVAAARFEHVRLDKNGQYQETIDSGLNECLNIQPNIDQGPRHFRTDIPLTMFNEGVIAIIPVDLTADPRLTTSWDVKSFRVGVIVDWQPQNVKVRAYNEKTGKHEEMWLPKSIVAIVENPFYSVMNEPNSTLQRLIRKLSLLDNVDEISSSGKLDIIIQLPYVVKSETRKGQAKKRVEEISEQLQGSTYGIAYTDGTEKITQLNRAVENNLLSQVQYLKEELYNELGLTPAIMNGTADDVAMLNYYNRTIEPILDAVAEQMIMKFLSKTARTQGQSIMYFQSPFKFMPVSSMKDLIDTLSRNQIVTPNEFRPVLGLKPSKEPQANQLVNSNMPLDKQITDQSNPADAEEAELDRQMAELGIT